MTFIFHIPPAALWFVGGAIVGVVIFVVITNFLFSGAIGRIFGW